MKGLSRENRSYDKTSPERPVGEVIFVHDAPGLFAGLPLILPGKHYTTPQVVAEVLDRESRERLERVLEAGRLVVTQPTAPLIRERGLSEADSSVLTLALELAGRGARVVIVSDDYLLQRKAREKGLDYMPVKTLGYEKANRLTRGGKGEG